MAADDDIFKVGVKLKSLSLGSEPRYSVLNVSRYSVPNISRLSVPNVFGNATPNISKNAFIIEGGGTKGVYAIGVLLYLFEDNTYINLSKIDIFGGTSVGSYLATVLSLGCSREDLVAISKIINMSKLIDSKYKLPLTMYRFMTGGHLYNDDGRIDIIQKVLNLRIDAIKKDLGIADEMFGGKDLTFGHVRKLISTYPSTYKHLLINLVDISKNDQIFMTTLNTESDDIKLSHALLGSSAIPFIFKPMILPFDLVTQRYCYETKNASTTNHLIDGGVSTNNPLDFFLINEETYSTYNLWLLKFTTEPSYTKIDGVISLLRQLTGYLVSGKNDIKMDLVQGAYHLNIINLHSNAGTLDIYTRDQIQKIIDDIYKQCLTEKLFFGA